MSRGYLLSKIRFEATRDFRRKGCRVAESIATVATNHERLMSPWTISVFLTGYPSFTRIPVGEIEFYAFIHAHSV